MNDTLLRFLLAARWTSALVAVLYHVRFLLFVNYDAVQEKSSFVTAFYFVTGLGHESYAVFFVVEGILAGHLLKRQGATPAVDRTTAIQRAGALYRILLPSLVLGAAMDTIGIAWFNQTGLYTDFPDFSTPSLDYGVFLGNMLLLQPFFVPTFGGNSMLYLPSYLFWSFILLTALTSAEGLGRLSARAVQGVLLAAVLAAMPFQFVVWCAIWLSGVVLVFLGASRVRKPNLLLALAVFAGALLVSRFIGTRTGMLPPQWAGWLVEMGFLLAGLGFATLAWALYPAAAHSHRLDWGERMSGAVDGWSGQAASFTFFCHFPVIMLLVGMAARLLGEPLRQQPSTLGFAAHFLLLGACAGTSVLVMRALGWAARALRFRRMPLG